MLKESDKSKYFKIATLLIMTFFNIQFSIVTVIAQDYYPLEIGNQWVYKIEGFDPNVPPPYFIDTLRVNVRSDTLLNGYDYFVLDTTDLSGGKIVRADSNNIYYYNECDSSDVLFYRLNAEVNDFWVAKLNGVNYKIVLLSIDSKKYFGFLTTTLKFQIGDYPWNFVEISKDFGAVHYVFSGAMQIHKNLIGCKLTNKYYGGFVSVQSDFMKAYTLELFQNYPNPFNSSTTIRYTLPQGKSTYHVTLKIYDINGRLVHTLVDQNQAAGTYSVQWDGRDQNGIATASGVYFCIFQAGDLKSTKKMLLIH